MGKNVSGWQRVGCIWLRTTHLALFLTGSLYSRHWTGKEQPLPSRPSSFRGGESPATPTPCAKKGHTRGTPRDTNQTGKESCCLSIIRKTKFSSRGQHTLLHLNYTQKKWELDKKDPCFRSSTEPWLTPNPGTWHHIKLHSARRMGNGRGSLKGS